MHRRHERRTSYSLPRPPPGYEPADSAAPPPTAPAAVAYDFDTDDAEEQQAHNAPTPRLVGLEFGEASASPMSSNFEPETPGNVVATFAELQHGVAREKAKVAREEEGEDLHAQFCSVLLLDLGNGTAIPLGASPGVEPRPDPFTLLAC
ncbi:hypothetical protein EX895_002211 [Sporisorium graminicola]|uniref:Uncharacterized protein n=1 Tax=Sporisorium graminicola TaxID=280036 RepID=A0A4U7KWT7_9BASI|nr:hypothetical protein EX895_002211 [Sporisorium graminicola]TKY88970.1 hypothetical protein EX895_002211 [Sporisorium graminicola]